MSFDISLGNTGSTTVVRLSGDLADRDVAALRRVVDEAAGWSPRRLVVDVHALASLVPAALRCLAFAQQHLPASSEIVVEGASPALQARLRLAGLDRSMTIVTQGTRAAAA
ncbi:MULTISPECIES: STAS domain-containing protein [unclassified Streptomyces]|uniref:STAS domain-containing protein n=1 Tax=unclassified Streptomyces TaxID=2593676 RepID=UPI00383031C0